MVEEPQDQKRIEDLKRKAEEVKRTATKEEANRLDSETVSYAQKELKNLRASEEQIVQQKLGQARKERETQENALKNLEAEYRTKIEPELQKKIDQRRQAEEERRKLEEERARKKEEEEERRNREDELRRVEEERRLKDTDEQRRREEQQQRLDLEQQRRDEEQRRIEEERKERIASLIENAENYFANGDNENALVEIAKALVNDPVNQRALDLETQIKTAIGGIETPISEASPEKRKPNKRVPSKTSKPSATEKKRFSVPYILRIIALLLIIVVVIIFQLKKPAFRLPATVAILPWGGSSGSLEENILGSSIAEEVTRRLGSVKTLHVLGFSSGYNLKQRTKEPEREAFGLGYTYLLLGKFSRSENSVSIEIKLVDSLGNEEWSRHYVKPFIGLAELPAEISQHLIDALGVQTGDISPGFKSATTCSNPDSYLFYLRGKEILLRRTQESSENAYLLFLQAIQQDPGFSEGFASAADVLEFRMENGWSRGDSVVIQSQHLADAAVRENPLLDIGYIAKAKILAFQKKYAPALACLDTAQSLAPNNSNIDFEKGKIFLKIGKYADAINKLNDAYKYNGSDPEVLQNIAAVYQLVGSTKQGMPYHEAALKYVADPLAYLAITLSDAISGDPDLRLSQSNRIIAASYRRINMNSSDYVTLYHLARLRQIMGDTDAVDILKTTTEVLQNELRKNPKDAHILMYLALSLTRMGRYSEAITAAERAAALAPSDDLVKYRIAQTYSLQMYDQKEKKLNEKKKETALKYLREALALNYRVNEITNSDFYNMFDQPDFRTLIQEPF